MKNTLLLLVTLLIFLSTAKAQELPNKNLLNINLTSSILIKGTSSLHDWESIAEKTVANLTVDSLDDISIETLTVNVDVFSIKSGKKVMDRLTYKALKAKEHPFIQFIFKQGEVLTENDQKLRIKLIGDLSIAGVTKNVTVNTHINKSVSEVRLKGTHKLKMTDFGIKPPTALLGTIKTGDEITIEFDLKFQ